MTETTTLTDFIAEKKKQGLNDEDIMVLANARFGGQDTLPQQHSAVGGDQLGPDPAMVRRYQQMMKSYVKPKVAFGLLGITKDDTEVRDLIMTVLVEQSKTMERHKKDAIADGIMERLEGRGGFSVPKQFHSWVRQWQAMESARRKMDDLMSEAEILGIIVREHWHMHPQERAMLQMHATGPSSSGPANMYNPTSAVWGE